MKKKMLFGSIVLFAISLCLSTVAVADPNMQEGMWEIKVEMKMEGMPFPMPPVQYSQCLTKKDMVPHQKEKNKDCTMVSQKFVGDTATWVMKCEDKRGGKTESTGSVTYKGKSFEGKVHTVSTDSHGAKSEINLIMSGRRTGDCK